MLIAFGTRDFQSRMVSLAVAGRKSVRRDHFRSRLLPGHVEALFRTAGFLRSSRGAIAIA
jgi:hypothetical protein